MVHKDFLIVEKRDIVTDLYHRSFLSVDFSGSSSENHALGNFSKWHGEFLCVARKRKLPQIQIRFPFVWRELESRLKQLGYHPGLYVIEKPLSHTYALPDGIRELSDAAQIKNQLFLQQRIHFQFDQTFFCDPERFCYDEYLGDIQKMIDRGAGILYGLYSGGRRVGFIGLEAEDSHVYINELFVEEDYRGHGFGKLLMHAGFHYAMGTPFRKIWTTLAVQNIRGLQFYKSCGFHEVSQIDYYNL